MRDECLLVPRIPGVDEYMAALDEAVKTPPRSTKPQPEAALQKVAERWEQITERAWPRGAAASVSETPGN